MKSKITSQADQIADLEQQVLRIRQSGEISPGNLQNQVDGMCSLMLEVSRVVKLPWDMHLRDLRAHVELVMKLIPADKLAKLNADQVARPDR